MRVTNELDAEIGKRLRQARLVENLTQDGLAQKLGISFQQVQKYENGTNRVSSSRLWAIAQVLGLPMEYFFTGLGEVETKTKLDVKVEVGMPDRAIRVGRMLDEMPEGAIKDSIYGLIKAFSKSG